MILKAYTIIHTFISLVTVVTGFVAVLGMLGNKKLNGWTKWFVITAIATTVTGFFFPFHGLTPAFVLGLISVPFLAIMTYARYGAHLARFWRWVFVLSIAVCWYFNLFVLVVQSFQEVPTLHALAPKQTESVFVDTQIAMLLLAFVPGIIALFRFHPKKRDA